MRLVDRSVRRGSSRSPTLGRLPREKQTSLFFRGPVLFIRPMTELWQLGAADLAGRIRAGETSSREVFLAHLRRIEQGNPPLNAVTLVLGQSALEAADAAGRAVPPGAAAR